MSTEINHRPSSAFRTVKSSPPELAASRSTLLPGISDPPGDTPLSLACRQSAVLYSSATHSTTGKSSEGAQARDVLPNRQHRTGKVINTNPRNPNTPTVKIELGLFTDTLGLKDVIALGDDVKLGGSQLIARNMPFDEMGETSLSRHWPERA